MSDDTFIEGPLYAPRPKVYPQAVHGQTAAARDHFVPSGG